MRCLSAMLVSAVAFTGFAIADDIPAVAERVKLSVVVISTISKSGEPVGHASGFAVAPGIVATNVHVLEDASRFKITRSDGQSVVATGIWAFDKEHDIALIQLSDPMGKGNLPVLPFALDESIRAGIPVYIIGHPASLNYTLSAGVLSSVDRQLSDYDESLPGTDVLQTDAVTAGGSSGGPWLNAKGEVIAVHCLGLKGLPQFKFGTHVKYVRDLLARERTKMMPIDHFDKAQTLTSKFRVIFPPLGNAKPIVRSLDGLTFAGLGGDRNELGAFKIDGEWKIQDQSLIRVGGPNAAVYLGFAEDFTLDGIVNFGLEGGWFMLIGWNDGSGFLLRNIQLRKSVAWTIFEMKDGKVTKAMPREFFNHAVVGENPFSLEVENDTVSMRIGTTPITTRMPLPNYREGSIIWGTFPTQYGPKAIQFKFLRIRAN